MKIAVCLSGESRTWRIAYPSILKFFKANNPEVTEVKFFGHTWARNNWRIFDFVKGSHYYDEEFLDKESLQKEMQTVFNFEKFHVDLPYVYAHDALTLKEINKEHVTGFEAAANFVKPTTWCSMLYSCMMSNFLKQQYELENDMKFDVVVRARFDVVYRPDVIFENFIPHRYLKFHNALYSEPVVFPYEYLMPAINDVIYFGSSRVMDLIDTFYRVYHQGDIFKMTRSGHYDGALKVVGCGVLLYKWATIKNILPLPAAGKVPFDVIRRDTKITNILDQYYLVHPEKLAWGKPPE